MYAKIFENIMTSSLAEDFQTRHIFMDLLVIADPEGLVDMTPEAISRITNVPLTLLKESLCKLCKPDPQSRSKREDGRRLVPLDENRGWGWQIVNFKAYREIRNEDERRAYMRTYMRARRAQEAAGKQGVSNVSQCSKKKQYADAEAETVKNTRDIQGKELVNLYGEKVKQPSTDTSRPQARKNAAKLLKTVSFEDLKQAVLNYAEACEVLDKENDFRKNAGNFFGRESVYEDFLPSVYQKPQAAPSASAKVKAKLAQWAGKGGKA